MHMMLSATAVLVLAALFRLATSVAIGAQIETKPQTLAAARWNLPDAREVKLGGTLGAAYDRGVARLAEDPYRSVIFLRSDVSFETNRVFVNYSGDISGRFIQIASLISPPGRMVPNTLPEVLRDFSQWQRPDGHFGRDVDWNEPLEPESSNAKLLPIFWGNSRLLVALVEAQQAFGRPDLLESAKRLGDFYIATAPRFLSPGREAEYRSTGTYAAGYVTDYFPGIEGLALLSRATHDQKYLEQAERMARFFRDYDTLPIDNSHGNLVTHYGLLLLYEMTGNPDYLDRPRSKWQAAVQGGYVWPPGGVGEKFRVSFERDEGCSEADWLRLTLKLWELTGKSRYLESAERLVWNHYAMNRTSNGGYGHHEFVCDAAGPLLMKPQFTEALWCCTFHGLLGLHTLKSYLVAGSDRGIYINFPFDASAPVRAAGGRWQVSLVTTEPKPGQLCCRVRLQPLDYLADAPNLFIRRPAWADGVEVEDGSGGRLRARADGSWVRVSVPAARECQIVVRFGAPLRVEDRRLNTLPLDPNLVNRIPGATLFAGPHILLANADAPRPVLLAAMDRNGRLRLPSQRSGTFSAVQVSRISADQAELRNSITRGTSVILAPWGKLNDRASVAFVFDLITVPDDSELGRLVIQHGQL